MKGNRTPKEQKAINKACDNHTTHPGLQHASTRKGAGRRATRDGQHKTIRHALVRTRAPLQTTKDNRYHCPHTTVVLGHPDVSRLTQLITLKQEAMMFAREYRYDDRRDNVGKHHLVNPLKLTLPRFAPPRSGAHRLANSRIGDHTSPFSKSKETRPSLT